MLSMAQTGGRLPKDGQYLEYPFAETLHYAAVGVFKLNQGQEYLQAFDARSLQFMSPIKRERENSGRVFLEAGCSYVIVCSTEIAGNMGEFFLSLYFDQALRDVEVRRVFHPSDKNIKKEVDCQNLFQKRPRKLLRPVLYGRSDLSKNLLNS